VTAAILNFARRSARPRDWTDQEIAEFFRVQDALTQAGMQVGTDRGVTDEGEPWFVFYRPATEEVIAHFARIDGEFVADASAVAEPVRGRDLRHVLNQIVNRYAVVVPKRNGGNLFMHPAAMLTAFVATALMELEGPGGREPGAGDESRSAGKNDGGATRVAASSTGGVTPVNAAGRAVSFNDAGINADSAQSGAVLTAVLAAMGMSSAVEQGAVEASADADALKVARAGFAPLDSTPGRDAMDGGPARTTPRSRGGDETVGDAGSGVDQAQGGDAVLAAAVADLLDKPQAPAIDLVQGASDGRGFDRPLVAFDALARDIAGAGVSRALEGQAPAADDAATAGAPDAATGEGTSDGGESHALPSFDLNLVSFGEVALDLDGLRALFPSVSEEDVVDDLPTEGDLGATPDEPAEDGAQPPPSDGAGEAPGEEPGLDDGERTQPPEDKTDPAKDVVDDAPPTTADLVFSGSESQNATLRGVVDFVIEGQASAPTVTVSRDSFLGETASQYAAHNDALPDVVIFDSDVIELPAFVFMPGVVFVHMDNVKTGPIYFDNDPHSFDLDNGGSVMLIGVADVATEAV